MPFRHYDTLRIFRIAARFGSFSDAAGTLNLTKGAVSYQIKTLEEELGFPVFQRLPRGVALTDKGQELLATVDTAFEQVERQITQLQRMDTPTLTIGVSTYFASRWLSPRLMDFMQLHPEIRLRVQPMINFEDLQGKGIDLAIRWGDGNWPGKTIIPLFPCPAFPVGNKAAAQLVASVGLESAFSTFTLLRDREKSTAWPDWFLRAGMGFEGRTDTLMIPDPNVRVQAVIDGQGVALNDKLIDPELSFGNLYRLSKLELSDYGYFIVYPNAIAPNPSAELFAKWLAGITPDTQRGNEVPARS